MAEYSAFSLLANALKGNKDWKPAWRKPDPKASYDVIIIGGGGHGLATAYYLAKEHGITNVAVVEKGWLGSGNVGRNTTAVRSNYLLPANTRFYEHSMKLWENLSHELNYNVMFSQRGCLNLAHTPAQFDDYARRGNAMRHLGVDAELMTKAEIKRLIPALDISDSARFPVVGGLMQRRAGTARHDAVAWGYARGADRRGVDIIENCEVTGFLRDGDRISGVTTSRGDIRARKVAVAVAGSTGRVMQMAGIETMPIGPKSICDGLMSRRPGDAPFAAVKTAGVHGITVDDQSVRRAMRIAFERMKLVLEPSGAASIAALLGGKVDVKDKTVLVVATGGNVSLADFMAHMNHA
ncbi:FAD-dependent oxidoreductase [Mesorhizobium sp. M7A.F.Ca.CA.003.01.2.1]|nr:FAD-dependent oxidoreductase [Mesorhizobium sp. M7A.F.Ca.CA.003.01.2.1]